MEGHGEIQSFSFEQRLANGMMSEDEARQMQAKFSGKVIGRGQEGEAIIAQVGSDEVTFQNAADMFRWVNQTGGILESEDGNPNGRVGETVDDMLARKANG